MEPDPRWICGRIRRLSVYSQGVTIDLEDDRDAVFVTDRKIFDRELARSAASAGVEVLTKTQATGVMIDEGQVRGIRGKCIGDDFVARGRAVVAADGIESRVARWAGIDTTLDLKDVGSCAQYHLTDIDIDPECIEVYFGSEKAPGGYAWVFPKGKAEANVGLSVVYDGRKSRRPIEYLDDFVQTRFPGAHILGAMAGAVPICGRLPRLSAGGIVAIGDAGRLSDPLTGEGILNGMISGRIAGNVIADCVRKGDTSAAALGSYDQEIAKVLGPALDRNYILKEHLRKASDTKFALMFRAARAMGVEKFPISALLSETFSPRSRRAAVLMRLLTG
jgi:digeranylgeranylglycerophospholipid reductase